MLRSAHSDCSGRRDFEDPLQHEWIGTSDNVFDEGGRPIGNLDDIAQLAPPCLSAGFKVGPESQSITCEHQALGKLDFDRIIVSRSQHHEGIRFGYREFSR